MDKTLQEEEKIEGEVGGLIDQGRVMAFSDAVFAFAATLLVLKIDLPGVTAQQLTSSTDFFKIVQHLWPQYLANVISFLVIGYYWINHHAIFGLVRKYDMNLVWINMLFLICLSFLPFPVDLYGENSKLPFVVVFYSASLAMVGYMLFLVWWYGAHKNRLISKNLTRETVTYYSARNLVAPVIFTLSIPLVYVHPLLAQACWILIILGNVLVNKFFKRRGISEIEKVTI